MPSTCKLQTFGRSTNDFLNQMRNAVKKSGQSIDCDGATPSNSALLTDAFSSLRCAYSAAKRGRWMAVLSITAQALAALRKTVAAAEAKGPVGCVWWQPRQARTTRGRNGETEGTWVSEGQRFVGLLDYADPGIHEVVKDF